MRLGSYLRELARIEMGNQSNMTVFILRKNNWLDFLATVKSNQSKMTVFLLIKIRRFLVVIFGFEYFWCVCLRVPVVWSLPVLAPGHMTVLHAVALIIIYVCVWQLKDVLFLCLFWVSVAVYRVYLYDSYVM